MSAPQHTPGPWYVGCQNDGLFVVAGRRPAPNNDYPWHDAPRVALCKVFAGADGDCLPVDAYANAHMIAAAPELLEALVEILGPLNVCCDNPNVRDDQCLPVDMTMGELRKARAAIAKARGA